MQAERNQELIEEEEHYETVCIQFNSRPVWFI